MSGSVREVSWPSVADRCEEIGAVHHRETSAMDGEYSLNRDLMQTLWDQGWLRVWVATVNGEIVGYSTWTRDAHLEVATPSYTMGHLFVLRGFDHGIGLRMLNIALDTFREEGIRTTKLHHTMAGRGPKLAAVYLRMGARERQREYLLEL